MFACAAKAQQKADAIQQEVETPAIDVRAPLDAVASWFTVPQPQAALRAAGDAGEGTQTSPEFALLPEDQATRREFGYPSVRIRVDPDSGTIRSATVAARLMEDVERAFGFVTPEGAEVAGERSPDGDEWGFGIAKAGVSVRVAELAQCSIHCRQWRPKRNTGRA
jgi:hypothetical protein